MKKICDSNKCTGCGACMNICPNHCIDMQYNDDGFLYPIINREMCINCFSCKSVCPGNTLVRRNDFFKSYIATNNSDQEKLCSSSGGIFSSIAEYILGLDGVVFAARFDEKYTVVFHEIVENRNQLAFFRGSKYLQSTTGECFKEVKRRIEAKQFVLFVGTPCQIAGLKAFLRIESKFLISVDFVCHGVISQKAYMQYLSEQLHENESLAYFSFRDKQHGHTYLQNHVIHYTTDLGREYDATYDEDLLGFGYSNNLLSRPSCSICQYASSERVSDITLCDYTWDINLEEQKKGASGVLINSCKGLNLFENLSAIDKREIEKQDVLCHQKHIKMPATKHKNRDLFFRHLDKGFTCSAKMYFCEYMPWLSLSKRIKRMLRNIKQVCIKSGIK